MGKIVKNIINQQSLRGIHLLWITLWICNGLVAQNPLAPALSYNVFSQTTTSITGGTVQGTIANSSTVGVNMTTAFAILKSTSYDMAAMAQNITPSLNWGTATISLTLPNTVNVWNESYSTMSQFGTFNFTTQPSSSKILIINVNCSSTPITWAIPTMTGLSQAAGAPYVIWNFYNVSGLTIANGGTLEGSLLAPNASVTKTGSNNIDGQIICTSYTQSAGQARSANFAGSTTIPTRSPVTISSTGTITAPTTSCEGGGAALNRIFFYAYNGGFQYYEPISINYTYSGGILNYTGTVREIGYANRIISFNINASGEVINPPLSSPHPNYCAFPSASTFRYFTTVSGTMTGSGDFAGLSLSVSKTSANAPTQVGTGGNADGGTITDLGISSWLQATTNSLPSGGAYYFGSVGTVTAVDLLARLIPSACSNVTTAGTIVANQSTCNSTYDPSILTETVAPSGGTGTLEYQWQSSPNGTTWSDISSAIAQTYDPPSISVTTYYRRGVRRAGCSTYLYSSAIVVTFNPLPSASISGGGTICNGQLSTLTASGGGTYLWSTGATSSSISVSPSTTTSYIVTVTSAAGCSASASGTVTVNPLPSASISGGGTICNGQLSTLTASGGGTYLWNTAATTAAISVSPSTTTTYTVTVTSAAGCKASASGTVTVNPLPSASISGGGTICNGQLSTLTASGGGTYLWSTGATSSSISVSPSTTTSYIVTVTSTAGCKASASGTVTVNPLPSASISGGGTICNGQLSTLTASGGGTYLWSTGATSSSISVSPSTTTSYIVTVTSAAGCKASASTVVTVIIPPNAGIASPLSICKTEISATTDLFAQLTGEQAGGTWTSIAPFPTGMTAISINSKITAGVLERKGLPAGVYTFRYTVTGTSPCPNDTEDVIITINSCCPPVVCLPTSSTRL